MANWWRPVAKNPFDKPGLLLVANWDSDVGYAWWLMESYWAALAEDYQGQMTSILAYPSISKLPDVIEKAPISPMVVDFSRFSPGLLRTQLRFLRRHRVKVMYLSDRAPRHWFYLLYRLAGVRRILVHDHTPGLRTRPQGIKRLLKKLMNRIPAYTADACIGATEYIRERFVRVGCVPEHKCFAADNGIPLELPELQNTHERFGIPSDRKIIVTAARANRYKGAVFALEALAHMKRSQSAVGWHYLYLGDGPDRDMLLQTARKMGLENDVSFPGRVSGVTALLPQAALALHPSRGEVGYSLSILEYMLCGLPVVVPDNPSVCGATEDGKTGVIYREGDVEAAAEALAGLLNNDDARKRMGEEARKTVETRFSLTQTHHKLLDIFHRTVPKVNRHGSA
ncbi:glycosyltransferase family 4 protein [Marinimicrobium agarilyticum]|uniref:glycosyltransferase family 4 protein n=1 Tax=Marinimicrobium agarilyticum TaxID=306546 RepID=UPI00042A41B0|nr:glycosyltransferase family 4 protein [Marinimicrobium agarilyticum]